MNKEPTSPASDDAACSLRAFQREVGKWAAETFPNSTDSAKLEHLKDEVIELQEKPDDAEEMADCLLILLHHAEAHGVDLMAAACAKFAKCKSRKWGSPDERGVARHIEEENR